MKAATKHIILLVIFLTTMLTACDKNPQDLDSDESFYYMATLTSADAAAGSVFDLQIRDDSRHITLNAPYFFDSSLAIGKRTMLHYYVIDDNDDVKTIKVKAHSSVLNDKLRIAEFDKILAMQSNPVQIMGLWRSGNYINFNGYLQMTGKSRMFILVIDESTEHDSVVEAYLIDDIKGETGLYYRRAFGSWDISALWKRESCKMLRVYVNDERYPDKKYYEFAKQQ